MQTPCIFYIELELEVDHARWMQYEQVDPLAAFVMADGRFVMKLREFMTTKLESVDHSASAYEAIEKMVDRRIRSLLVRFPGSEREYGVMTARDVVFKVLAKGIDPKAVKASDVASRPLFCVNKDAELGEVARLMEEANVGRVFVCDGEKLAGVISLIDLMAAKLIERARGNELS